MRFSGCPGPAARPLRVWLPIVVLALSPLPAAAQLDPSGTWSTWQTEHFRIHIRRERAHLVQRVADEAERAYRLLASELVPPRGTVDIAVFDNVDFSNGAASVFPSNKLFIFLAPPATELALAHYDEWVRVVLVHELTHVFHLDRTRGFWRGMQYMFGRAPWTFPNAYRSSWVKEGLATYYESRFTDAGRVRGAFHTQLLASTATSGVWPRSEDATLVSPRWPGGQRPYAWGSRFFASQVTSGGDSLPSRFVERSAGKLWPLTVGSPLQEAGGTSVRAGWKRMRESYTPPSGTGLATVLARGLLSRPAPVASPSGHALAYLHSDGRRDATVRVLLADSSRTASHRVNAGVRIAWHGTSLIIGQLDYASPASIRSHLYLWRELKTWERISNTERFTSPFSNGARVGGVRVEDGRRRPLWLDPDGGHEPVNLPPADDWGEIAVREGWGAGDALLKGRRELVVWPLTDPSAARRVTLGNALLSDVSWAPDGTVLFVSEVSGLPQVYRYDRGSDRVSRLTTELGGARSPQELPDGSLVFTSVFHDGMAVMQLAPDQLADAPTVTQPTTSMEVAPRAAVQERGYNPWPALVPKYWNPVLHVESETGTFLGAFTSADDPIGRTQYLASLAVAPSTGRTEGVLSVAHQRWQGAAVNVSVRQSWLGFGLLTNAGVVPFGEREQAATVGVRLARRWWRSGAVVRLATGLEQFSLFDESSAGALIFEGPTSLAASISGSLFYRSRPALAISVENGVRLDALYERQWSLRDGASSFETRGAVAGFLGVGLPGFARWVLALRLTGGGAGGSAPRTIAVGGESGDRFEVAPGLIVGTGRRAFALRGYPRVGGFDRALTAVAEARIPIALIGRGMPIIPIVFDRVSATLFYEFGTARIASDGGTENNLQSAGTELIADLGILYDVPTRVRVGAAVPLTDGLGVSRGDIRAYVTFGTSF